VTYVPVPINRQDSSVIEQWIERMTFIADDLSWLLQQDHRQFWCEVSDFYYNGGKFSWTIELIQGSIQFTVSWLDRFLSSIRTEVFNETDCSFSTGNGCFFFNSRPHRSIPAPNYFSISNGEALEKRVSRLVFLCILRLSTHKESSVRLKERHSDDECDCSSSFQEFFFTPEGFGNTIYENYIFDIPRLLDLCHR
jgi:hypothetical protein